MILAYGCIIVTGDGGIALDDGWKFKGGKPSLEDTKNIAKHGIEKLQAMLNSLEEKEQEVKKPVVDFSKYRNGKDGKQEEKATPEPDGGEGKRATRKGRGSKGKDQQEPT